MKYYIAYGSNLHLEQMSSRCPTAKVVGIGALRGYRLAFNRYATVVKAKTHHVPVAVWEIDSETEKTLDSYEGYPYLYGKKFVPVQLIDGRTIEGLIYVLNRPGLQLPPSRYFKTIMEGYHDMGFDVSALEEAYHFTETDGGK